MFEGIGPEKLLLLVLVVLLLFGARRIPEIGRSLGQGIRGFKTSLSGADEEPVEPRAPRRRLDDSGRDKDRAARTDDGREPVRLAR